MKLQDYLSLTGTFTLLASLLLVGCSTEDRILINPDSDKSIKRQSRVDSLVVLLSTAHMPQGALNDPDSEVVKDKFWFDVSECFDVLSGLTPEPGSVLDYVYWFNGLGGEPILYCRQEQTPAFRTFSEFQEAVGDVDFVQMRSTYLNHIVIDGTEEGYFDFAVQRLIGTQFYLYWHAAYNDTKIICTKEAMESTLTVIEHHSLDILPDARKLILKPEVKMEDEQVIVSFVTFTKWGGFYRRTLTIKREFPHQIIQEDKTLLIEYNCGYVY